LLAKCHRTPMKIDTDLVVAFDYIISQIITQPRASLRGAEIHD
jgi:hypothetical protein